MTNDKSVNESVETTETEETEEQLDLEVKRVKSLKTNVKGGWDTRGSSIELSLDSPLSPSDHLRNGHPP